MWPPPLVQYLITGVWVLCQATIGWISILGLIFAIWMDFGHCATLGIYWDGVCSFSQLVVFCEDECLTFHKPRNTLVQNFESRSYRSHWLMDNGQGSNENLHPEKIHRCSLSMMKVILVCPTDCSKCQYMAAPVFVFSLLVCNHRPVFQ